jgi:ribonuclease P protein component
VLPKINRGLTLKEFKLILDTGVMIQTPLFGVRYIKSEKTRYGWVVSKKISTKAVDRNRVKRRLSEVIRKEMIEKVEMVVLVKKSMMGAKMVEIEKNWGYVREKIGA